ncbi:hypothetical protein F511_39694 [Dorcoceras hygrometricum]|uniref:Uncharacterized protein n=1 Tax=Dorcoceras hygrometricum TaxID=472368 RepID=A0A2Z7B3P3_9LAMI|nr:hypothetical protein F511_39694 [Dorcoceras hygrometricum]
MFTSTYLLSAAGSSPRSAEQPGKPEQQVGNKTTSPRGTSGSNPSTKSSIKQQKDIACNSRKPPDRTQWKIEWLIVAPARKPPARSHGISSGHNHPPTSIQVTATEDWEQLNQHPLAAATEDWEQLNLHPPAAATEDWEQLNPHPPAALNRGYATPHRTTKEELQQSNISWLTKEPLAQYAMQMQ